MAKEFKFAMRTDRLVKCWQEVVQNAAAQGVFISPSGEFTGKFAGKISIAMDEVTIRITDKPFFVPWGMIESKLREVFAKA